MSKILRIILVNLLWIILSLAFSMLWIRLEVGKPVKHTGFLVIFNGLEELIIFYVGGVIGLVSIVPFFFINEMYIQKKIETRPKRNIARVLWIVFLTILFTIIHYILEFVVDWI